MIHIMLILNPPKSSLYQLRSFQRSKVFVMGDMGELGEKISLPSSISISISKGHEE